MSRGARLAGAAAISAITVGAVGFAAPVGADWTQDTYLAIAYNTKPEAWGVFTGIARAADPEGFTEYDAQTKCKQYLEPKTDPKNIFCQVVVFSAGADGADTCGAVVTGNDPDAAADYATAPTRIQAEQKARAEIMRFSPAPPVWSVHVVVSACSRDGMPPPPSPPRPSEPSAVPRPPEQQTP